MNKTTYFVNLSIEDSHSQPTREERECARQSETASDAVNEYMENEKSEQEA